MYDTRLGRRWNVDPVLTPNESPYLCFGGSPILYTDPNGDFKTKFGAWLYSIVHSGTIERDSGGEYYVGNQVEYTGEGVGVAYQRRFEWKGRNVGKNLQLEYLKKQWKANNDWRNVLDNHGIDYKITHNLSEARWNMLGHGTTVLLPNVFKTASVLSKSTKPGIKNVDDLLQTAGELKRVKGAKQGFVNGNALEIYNSLIKGGTKVNKNLYRLSDGTLINLHKSTKTGIQTIDINRAGQIYKIRVQ